MSNTTTELVQLIALLLLVALFYFVVIPMGVVDPDGMGMDEGLPPSFSPRLLAIIAATILMVRIVQLVVAPNTAITASNDSAITSEAVTLSWRVLLGVLIALVYALFVMPIGGFVIGSLFLLLTILVVLGERSPLKLIVLPLIVTAAVWLLFAQLLSVRLPVGTIFQS